MNRYHIMLLRCKQCGIEFVGENRRRSGRYCSVKCRVAAFRARKRAKALPSI